MKTLALLVVLALHSTGLWSHLASDTRAHLSARATGVTAVANAATNPNVITTNAPLEPSALPIQASTEPLALNATAAIAIDRSTATVLYSKNASAKLPIASVTKIVTALVILSRHSPGDTVTIPTLPDYPTAAETAGLFPGDNFRLSSLLEAMLVPSANDAADALAIWDAGSVTKFAARMNAKMSEWGIVGARFSNASGLQDEGNYASASALAKIAGLLLANRDLATIVTHTSISLTSGQGRTYNLKTTNDLLASGTFYGIKTGYTPAAGECFVGLTRTGGHDVITVVLGAGDRFGATTTLTNWISRTWQWL